MSDERPKHRWLTTRAVVEAHGFDPTPYDEPHAAGARYVRNQLVQVVACPHCAGWQRLWLEEDVLRVARAVRAEQEAGKVDATRLKEEELARRYRKGMR